MSLNAFTCLSISLPLLPGVWASLSFWFKSHSSCHNWPHDRFECSICESSKCDHLEPQPQCSNYPEFGGSTDVWLVGFFCVIALKSLSCFGIFPCVVRLGCLLSVTVHSQPGRTPKPEPYRVHFVVFFLQKWSQHCHNSKKATSIDSSQKANTDKAETSFDNVPGW